MSKHGMADAELEAIELRLLGADHRPWGTNSSHGGDMDIHMASKKSISKAVSKAKAAVGEKLRCELSEAEFETADSLMSGDLILFNPAKKTTPDMCEFVANAPEDIEKLLREVKLQRSRADKLEEKFDRLTEVFKDATRDRDMVTDRLRTVVKHWHLFQEALGAEVLP